MMNATSALPTPQTKRYLDVNKFQALRRAGFGQAILDFIGRHLEGDPGDGLPEMTNHFNRLLMPEILMSYFRLTGSSAAGPQAPLRLSQGCLHALRITPRLVDQDRLGQRARTGGHRQFVPCLGTDRTSHGIGCQGRQESKWPEGPSGSIRLL
jgi:hypothetical protein